MKILHIRLKNLNSLRGEHEVDLEGEPLGSAGIFAITGPTGAGKSTLLDAITLALYGRAARYGENANPEDMMSRHTGECQAEVIFEVDEGRFRAVWQLRRSRGKAEGNLQPGKRYLYDANDVVLASKIRDVDKMVEDLCGLDYHRFTRSVLLAQGEFAKFLKASADERAALLESLTGTVIYSELSILVHEELSRRNLELAGAESVLDQIHLLTDAEREKREEERNLLEDQFRLNKVRKTKLDEQRMRGRSLRDLLQAETQCLTAQQDLARERETAQADLARLGLHRKAQVFVPALTQLVQATDQSENRAREAKQQAEAATRAKETWRLGLFQAGILANEAEQDAQKTLAQAQEDVAQSEKRQREAQDWLDQNQGDAGLATALPEIKSKLSALTTARQEEKRARQQAGELPHEFHGPHGLKRAQDRLEQLLEAQNEAARIEALDKLEGEWQGVQRIQAIWGERLRFQIRLEEEQPKGEPLAAKVAEADAQLQQVTKDREGAQELCKSYQQHLETARRVASLEAHRSQLTDGDPCPLCGSEHHPYAEHGSPNAQLTELETKVRESEQAVEKLSRHRETCSTKLTQLQAEQASLTKTLGQLNQDIADCARGIEEVAASIGVKPPSLGASESMADDWCRKIHAAKDELEWIRKLRGYLDILTRRQAVDDLSEELAVCLQPYGKRVPLAGDEQNAWAKLEERRSRFANFEDQLRRERELRSEAEGRVKAATSNLELLRQQTRELREHLEQQGPAPANLSRPSWDSLEAALREIDGREEAADSAGLRAEHCAKEAENARQKVEQLTSALNQKVADTEFSQVDRLRAALLESSEESRITALETRLKSESDRLEGRLEHCRREIKGLREGGAPEGEDLQSIEADWSALESAMETLTERLTVLKGELRRDTEARAEFEAKTASLKTEREKLKVWQSLHGLIGSATGKRFRLFAQGISLDLLVRHANRHLSRLTERYLLKRREGEDLEWEIEDLFQACVSRPMASLSGGESFLASLALALGLSDLAGRNARIDSLFIDEGFGSLDSDSLEIAISALEGLRQSNKTVGVISHVEILKERIATRINVEKHPNGTSDLVIS